MCYCQCNGLSFANTLGRRNKALKALQFGITFAPAHPSLQSAIAKLNDGETNITNCFMKQQSPLSMFYQVHCVRLKCMHCLLLYLHYQELHLGC